MFQVLVRGMMAIALLGTTGSQARCAEIKRLSSKPISIERIANGECNVSLDGPIKDGDAAKIESVVGRDVPDGGISLGRDYRNADDPDAQESGFYASQVFNALCLTSDGGSFEGAVKIVETLRHNGIATVVPKNGRCLSACAVAFLGGSIMTANSDGGSRAPFRVMHVSATLGFHAPFFPENLPADQLVPASMAIEFLNGGLRAIRELDSALEQDDHPSAGVNLPAELLVNMLTHLNGDDFEYVDTIDKAGEYNVRLAGVPPIPIDLARLYVLCSNAVTWQYKLHSPTDAALTSWSYGGCDGTDDFDYNSECDKAIGTGLAKSLLKGISITSRHDYCAITGKSQPGDDYIVEFHRVRGILGERSFEPWASLPHYVTLKALAESPSKIDPAILSEVHLNDRDVAGSVDSGAKFLAGVAGHALVLDAPYVVGKEHSYIVINFLDSSKFEMSDGQAAPKAGTYEVDRAGVCFTFTGAQAPKSCAVIKKGKENYNGLQWFLDGATEGQTVRFHRFGRIDLNRLAG